MKILSISTDRHILSQNSSVSKRQIDYGSLFEEVNIIVFSLKKHHPAKDFSLSENVHVYPTNSRNKIMFIFDGLKIGTKIMKEKKIDIITAQNPFETSIVGYRLSKKFKSKFNIQLHTDPFAEYFTKSDFFHHMRILMGKYYLKKAGTIRVVSKRIKDGVLNILKDSNAKISVLPIYVDIDQIVNKKPEFNLHERFPQFDTIVLMLSRLEPEKNIPMGINAFKEVVEKYPKTGLIIIGKGSQLNKLEYLVTKNNLEKNVHFLGWVEDVISAFKTSDIFLLTSDFEGYAMTLVEAASSGAPIISTDVGLVGDVLPKNEGLLVIRPRDDKALSEALMNLVWDKELRLELSEKAFNFIQKKVKIEKEDYLRRYYESIVG